MIGQQKKLPTFFSRTCEKQDARFKYVFWPHKKFEHLNQKLAIILVPTTGLYFPSEIYELLSHGPLLPMKKLVGPYQALDNNFEIAGLAILIIRITFTNG